MERQPYGIDRVFKTRRIPHRITKKLRRSYKETIQQETKKLSRTKDWEQHVAREQKYPLKQTFEEVGLKKI